MHNLIKMIDIPQRILRINEKNIDNTPRIWDIFTFSINQGEYMYWRVISVAPKAPWCWEWDDLIIYYFYDIVSNTKTLDDFSALVLTHLLVWPVISYRDYFQLGYFEIVGYEAVNDKNVHFPICFEHRERISDGEWYTDQDNNLIQKQTICWFAGVSNIFSIEAKILQSLWESIPETQYDREKFDPINTDDWGDFIWWINGQTRLEELFSKVDNPEFNNKHHEFERREEIEALVSIEIIISIASNMALELDKNVYVWYFAFFNENAWKKEIPTEIIHKSKQFLERILTWKASELKQLRQESWRYKYLKKRIEKRIYQLDNLLNSR